MTREEAKQKIVDIVVEKQGIRSTALISSLPDEFFGKNQNFEIGELLTELILEDRVAEVEYVLPQMDYRAKSFLLPAGTKIRLAGDYMEYII